MGQLNITKRSGGWQFRFEGAKVRGKRQQISKGGFATKGEALKAGNEAMHRYNSGEIVCLQSEISVADAVDLWYKNSVMVNTKPTTQNSYSKKLNSYILPEFGKLKLSSVHTFELQQFINKMFNKGFSRNTLVCVKAILTSFFTYAVVTLHLLQHTPMEGVKVPSLNAIPEVESHSKERIVMPPEVWSKITAYYTESSPYFIPLVLAYRCGLRLGEVFGLTWDDIDFDLKKLYVKRQMQSTSSVEHKLVWNIMPPKYNSYRAIDLDAITLNILLRAKGRYDDNRKEYAEFFSRYYCTERVYNSSTGTFQDEKQSENDVELCFVNSRECGSFMTPHTIRWCLSVIHKELGFPKYDFHSLRHTHCTMLLENGAPIKAVSERLGHKNLQVTLDVYTHCTPKMREQTLNILESIPLIE